MQISLMHCVSALQAAKRSRRQGERHAAESDSDSAACKRGRRLWEEIHTVQYHRWAKTAGAEAKAAGHQNDGSAQSFSHAPCLQEDMSGV